MIDPRELRIGNWVMTKEGIPIQVLSYFDKSIRNEIYTLSDTDFKYEEDDCDGIPLTVEILQRCGFKWDFSTYEYVDGMNNGELFFAKINTDWIIELGNGGQNISITLQYLHQLQNLYFCLKGKELEINL